MKAYIARQPIFNLTTEVAGYELLYRDEDNRNGAVFPDGNVATSRLLSDAVTIFGLDRLTDGKPAFVNFTETLLQNDFALMVSPREMTIEILEDVDITPLIVSKVTELKEKGYRIALDDYNGDERYKDILPLVDILKVDFMMTERNMQEKIPYVMSRLYPDMQILAEKVESSDDYEFAKANGYSLFQGYYFEKPSTIYQNVPKMSMITFNTLMAQLNSGKDLNFRKCAAAIRKDPLLTYRLLQKMTTLQYYRGQQITDVKIALVAMGQKEIRRWICLMLVRDNNVTNSTELVRQSLIRAIFCRKIIEKCDLRLDPETGYLIGMFSMLDRVMDCDMKELLNEIDIADVVKATLLNSEKTAYSDLLESVIEYENVYRKVAFKDFGISLSEKAAWRMYMGCMVLADQAFDE